MKNQITLLSAMAFGLALTFAAPTLRAEEAAVGAAPAPAPTTTPVTGKAKHERMKSEKATGAIEKVDADARSITIAGKTYKLADTLKVRIDGTEKTLADLQVGDTVNVRYTTEADGSLVAQGINKGGARKGGGKKK